MSDISLNVAISVKVAEINTEHGEAAMAVTATRSWKAYDGLLGWHDRADTVQLRQVASTIKNAGSNLRSFSLAEQAMFVPIADTAMPMTEPELVAEAIKLVYEIGTGR